MTLPKDVHSAFLGTDRIAIKKGRPPPITTSKPTARIVPLPTNNSSSFECNAPNVSMQFYHQNDIIRNQNHAYQNKFGQNSSNTALIDPLDLSEDIATANIKTKINQFEYLASRNYDRCPKFPHYPEKSSNFKESKMKNGFAKQEMYGENQRKISNGHHQENNELMFSEKSFSEHHHKTEVFDEDPEQIERKRLEEILTICAEYEKQAQLEKSTKLSPNRIKTNGSLPRERRLIPTSSSDQQLSTSPQPVDIHNQIDVSPFTFDVAPPNSACSLPGTQRTVFDFNTGFNKDTGNLRDQFADLDLLSEQLRKTWGVEHVSRNRIKTTMTPYRDGHPNSPYSTPQSPQFPHVPNRFYSNTNDNDRFQIQRQVIQSPYNQISSPIQTPVLNSPVNQSSVNSFKYLTLPKDTKLVASGQMEHITGSKFNTSDAENLIAMRKDLERAMVRLKAKLSENESYYEELIREFELEKALLIAEYKSRLTEKRTLQSRQQICTQRVQEIENVITETQTSKVNDQFQCGEKLATAQQHVKDIESNLNVLSDNKESNDYQLMFDKYLIAQEVLDNERKAFEDVEFHHLEKEADLLASKEELQRELRDLVGKIEESNICLKDLKSQLDHLTHTNSTTHNELERSKLQLHKRIEETRNHLKTIDLDMNSNNSSSSNSSSSNAPMRRLHKPASNTLAHHQHHVSSSMSDGGIHTDTDDEDECTDDDCDSTRSSGSYVLRTGVIQNDLGRRDSGCLMTQSVNETMLRTSHSNGHWKGEFGTLVKKIPSQGDIDRICKVTSSSPMNIIDDSVSLGKKTIESLMEIERNRHLHLVETGSKVIENERRRVSELKLKAQEEVRNEWARRKPGFSSTLNSTEDNSNISDDENNSKGRNSSDNSITTAKEMDLDSPSPSNFKRSTAKDKQRPLTRYLPIKSADLDLRQHIISAGHQVILCPYVTIDSSTCKGLLHKKQSKFNNWSRRWFVFDRTKRSLVYYTDKNEKKTKGLTYFQSIQDVYLDHSNSIKSPSPHLTFVMKTQQRIFYLMAPSAEAMRIWIDVIFTGAEGYCAFGQNF